MNSRVKGLTTGGRPTRDARPAAKLVSAFALRIARQQLFHSRFGRELSLQHSVHRIGDGHVDAARTSELRRFARRIHAFGDMAEVLQNLFKRKALSEL